MGRGPAVSTRGDVGETRAAVAKGAWGAAAAAGMGERRRPARGPGQVVAAGARTWASGGGWRGDLGKWWRLARDGGAVVGKGMGERQSAWGWGRQPERE
jgi:hypothetical protein